MKQPGPIRKKDFDMVNRTSNISRWRAPSAFLAKTVKAALTAAALIVGVGSATPAHAHGERNQEPFLRMRTLQWYDVAWSTSKLKVNDELTVTGRVRVFEDWPNNLPSPDIAFLSTAGPGAVMAKKESYLNETPMLQSAGLKLGREYEFKLVLVARHSGQYHIHPTLLVGGAGPLAGPGSWVDIAGDVGDFAYPIKTLEGRTIPDLATWGVGTVVKWHVVWAAIALFWILWWVRKPLWMPRHIALLRGREDLLITRTDTAVGLGVLATTLVLVIGGVVWAQAEYPDIIPLQGGKAMVDPLPEAESKVAIKVVHATYDVPGRSMKMTLEFKNNTAEPLQIGEFTTANLRFINPAVAAAKAAVPAGYPAELVSEQSLTVTDNKPLAPGEVRRIDMDATDALWEIERLSALITDPDNRFGGLLFFYDSKGARHISSVYGPIVPRFTRS